MNIKLSVPYFEGIEFFLHFPITLNAIYFGILQLAFYIVIEFINFLRMLLFMPVPLFRPFGHNIRYYFQ